MLQDLRQNKSESSSVDCKETLYLKDAGDCAQFIKHVAGLANTGHNAYLLLGVEDKTWIVKGISNYPHLLDCDTTQQQMNQALATRLDPLISVGYRTYPLEGTIVGLVCVIGKNIPYIVSIADARYGGRKTDGKDFYVTQGAVHIRRGTDTIVANRQSQLVGLIRQQSDPMAVIMALVFVAVIIGAGVGVAASLVPFGDPNIAALLGFVGGAIVGWVFHGYITKGVGGLQHGWLSATVRNAIGPLWGGVNGGMLGYIMVDSILQGRADPLHPLAMALIIGPLTAILLLVMLFAPVVALILGTKLSNLLEQRRHR
jgi:hypothetical protein